MTTEPVFPVLLRAADLIEKHGWCQNTYEDDDGRLDIIGAINKLVERNGDWIVNDAWEEPYMLALAAFERSIGPEMGTGDEWWDAADWNDRPGRTQIEVLDRLRRVGRTGE